MTATLVMEQQEIRIPSWVVDLESFRRWGKSDEFPKEGRICYLGAGEIWIDTTMEQLFTHTQLKTEIAYVLTGLSRQTEAGTYFADGASLTNVPADISSVPDGLFVKFESFDNGSIKLCEGAKRGFVELEGTPDMVVEIVSDSSVRKDKTELKKRYAKASIPEYWLIDARKPPLEFTIYKLTKQGTYKAVSKTKDGWLKSAVFGEAFKLTQTENPAGHPEFRLTTKS